MKHNGRAKCPKNYPYMCAKIVKKSNCASGTDRCCKAQPEECGGDEQGLRVCPSKLSFSFLVIELNS